ncbi:MAG: NDP-hexose 2,3-dehydratase family protein [Clostridia bacterium]|nr:NDP-hexose 2,3-dehydratase family protein [Clostridia bacterium]
MELNDILQKITRLNNDIKVKIEKISLDQCSNWSYNDRFGEICNSTRDFFQIKGIRKVTNGKTVLEQPVIIQNEIGFLGIIRKKINDEYYYLMQYKIEPGNINKIQISPTIQATKSNFEQKHGGKKPTYLEYFINSNKYKVVVDQIQSEQSSRFLGKRNRNIIIELKDDETIHVYNNYDWMTLKQIKELMRFNNLVNMDTRTVLSCLPIKFEGYTSDDFNDKALYRSMFDENGVNYKTEIYQYINDLKMFSGDKTELVPLNTLSSWSMRGNELVCNEPYSFKVVFCDIEIEGREVKHWCQPLFEAIGIADFVLFTCIDKGVRLFLVKCRPEIGCFDKVEIGPTIQRDFVSNEEKDSVINYFEEKYKNKDGVIFESLLSEEGGRFYHEQNRNIIMNIDKNDLRLPEGYFWTDYKTLNELVQVNNTLNIQLRNLLSVLEY